MSNPTDLLNPEDVLRRQLILEVIERCSPRHGASELGFRIAMQMQPYAAEVNVFLLRAMEAEGLIEKRGATWKVCGSKGAVVACAQIERKLFAKDLVLQSPGDAFPTTFCTGEGRKVLDYLVLFSDLENVVEHLDAEIASLTA